MIRSVAKHIQRTQLGGNSLVVVVSAMGNYTDTLIQLAKEITDNPASRELDMLISAGERISMALLSMALHELGVHSVSLTGSQCGILTSAEHGAAKITAILGDRIQENIDAGKVVIVAGFQGVNQTTKEITTLGRGGSDLTAVALGIRLSAERIELYKDVSSVYSASPRQVKNPLPISQIHYRTMADLAFFGSEVVHKRSVVLAEAYGVAIYIKPTSAPTETGTVITGDVSMENQAVKAITQKKDLCLLDISVKGNGAHTAALPTILEICAEKEVTVYSAQIKRKISSTSSETDIALAPSMDVSIVISNADLSKLSARLKKEEKTNEFSIEDIKVQTNSVESFTLVGAGLSSWPNLFKEFKNELVDLCLVDQIYTDGWITVVMDVEKGKTVDMERLHEKFVVANP